jgi:hypothetical protein
LTGDLDHILLAVDMRERAAEIDGYITDALDTYNDKVREHVPPY